MKQRPRLTPGQGVSAPALRCEGLTCDAWPEGCQLQTSRYRSWRDLVIARAGGRCEWTENGIRCSRCVESGDRIYADHIIERSDGGAVFDPANGQALCPSHHGLKTARERARRNARIVTPEGAGPTKGDAGKNRWPGPN
jgi:5-methylcytosine-specific restriction enzyme A